VATPEGDKEVVMNINSKQLAALFICSLIPWIAGNGLIPLLPVYAEKLGASSTVAGLYLAFSYLAIALGAISAGWVSGSRYRRKLPLIISGFVGIPFLFLMGQVKSILALTLLTALLWFNGGLILSLISILTGMSAGENERGKIFGILALTSELGAVLGGLGTGWLVKNWGYTTMFNVGTVFMLIGPLTAFFLEEKENKKLQGEADTPRKPNPLGNSYFVLLFASSTASIAAFFIVLIRSLAMSDMGFGPLEISSTAVVGGLISMPLPLLMGWLSDRINRKTILILGYLSAFAALIMMVFSKELWHFWLAFILQGIAVGSNGSIGNAWVSDLVPNESLGKGLALFGFAGWIGGIVGFALSGYLLQNLGLIITCIIGGLLALASAGLLIPIQAKSSKIDLANYGLP
jgi:DHA1 family multidrug resistance protein-like MFS transporter